MQRENEKTYISWDQVEKQITKEMLWLENNIARFFSHKEIDHSGNIVCRTCLLRKIALMIIYGDIKAREINKASTLENFWLKTKNQQKIYHGSDWHCKTIEKIEGHFKYLGFDIEREPTLNYGRADLGVYKKSEKNLLIEVGTTSLYKLWYNLNTMSKDTIYLIVPNDEKIIEFQKI